MTTVFGECSIFGGKFTIQVQVASVDDSQCSAVKAFAKSWLACLGAVAGCDPHLTPEQRAVAERLCKILQLKERGSSGEQANAEFLLQRELSRLSWSEVGLRSHQNAANPSVSAANTKALVQLKFTTAVTVRRAWFESLGASIASRMGLAEGVNKARYGLRSGHNGIALCGCLGAALSGAAVMARIAEMAMRECTRTDLNAFAHGFCIRALPEVAQTGEAAKYQDQSMQWIRDDFGYTSDASWNTPRKAKTATPTAIDGQASGQKRKAEFHPAIEQMNRFQPKAIGW